MPKKKTLKYDLANIRFLVLRRCSSMEPSFTKGFLQFGQKAAVWEIFMPHIGQRVVLSITPTTSNV
jgi:hypothetical protein